MLFCSAGIFADGITVLDNAGNTILSLITSIWVKAILTLALVIEFGVAAFGNTQGEGGMVKKLLPWIFGTAGILGAVSIVDFFFNSIGGSNGFSMLNSVQELTESITALI